jgi:hypothetical protein
VVGEPRQCEVLDFLGVGARCDGTEFIEHGLLPVGAPCSLRCQIGFPPWMQEGAGELDQSGHALGMGEQEVAGHSGPERMSHQDNPVVSPRIEQRRHVLNVAGERVLPLPG